MTFRNVLIPAALLALVLSATPYTLSGASLSVQANAAWADDDGGDNDRGDRRDKRRRDRKSNDETNAGNTNQNCVGQVPCRGYWANSHNETETPRRVGGFKKDRQN